MSGKKYLVSKEDILDIYDDGYATKAYIIPGPAEPRVLKDAAWLEKHEHEERTCTRDENGDCTQCGRHLSLEARYCKHCGARAVKRCTS